MELRVLFPAAFKATWYGRWGYGFGRAGFGIKPAAWKRAASAVSVFVFEILAWQPDSIVTACVACGHLARNV